MHGPYFIFVCSLQMCTSAVPWFRNVLSQMGHLKILMPKVFMDEDGYNFCVPETPAVGTSLGTADCDDVVGTGV